MDRVLALHAGSRGFDSHRGHMSERLFRSNRSGYPHPVSSELENSGIRVAVGDCSVTERRRWRPPYQTSKTIHVHAKHYKHNKDGRTAPGVCGTEQPLGERRYENWNTHTSLFSLQNYTRASIYMFTCLSYFISYIFIPNLVLSFSIKFYWFIVCSSLHPPIPEAFTH